ncbi:MAG: helix-turn-helix transcriptional regulator [Eubacteriales bacterium]|nr:helix-turn-helix transcriptional regulator [Eubacteriales bacterium]
MKKKRTNFKIDYITVGNKIKLRRTEKKLSQSELAEAAEISDNFLSSIERGVISPSLETLYAISLALDTTVDYFLLGYTHPNNLNQNVIDKIKLCHDENKLHMLIKIIEVILSD